jgi:hypothetical protein
MSDGAYIKQRGDGSPSDFEAARTTDLRQNFPPAAACAEPLQPIIVALDEMQDAVNKLCPTDLRNYMVFRVTEYVGFTRRIQELRAMVVQLKTAETKRP